MKNVPLLSSCLLLATAAIIFLLPWVPATVAADIRAETPARRVTSNLKFLQEIGDPSRTTTSNNKKDPRQACLST